MIMLKDPITIDKAKAIKAIIIQEKVATKVKSLPERAHHLIKNYYQLRIINPMKSMR